MLFNKCFAIARKWIVSQIKSFPIVEKQMKPKSCIQEKQEGENTSEYIPV